MSTNPNRWRDGSRVSLKARPDVTGRIKTVTRQIDGAKFNKVHPDSLEHAKFAGWASDWVLGAGAHQANCLDCGQAYRYETATYGDGFCPECNQGTETNSTAPETRSVSGSLHGARTPRAAVEPVTVPPAEKFDSPFD